MFRTRQTENARPELTPAELRARVDAALTAFLAERRDQLEAIDQRLRAQIDAADALLAGGKRLRAAFCYWAGRGAGASDSHELVRAAASLELLQASALIHDDVMDHSDVRRGGPSAHRRFEALHQKQEWSGSAERFGAGGAILLGDLLLCWTGEMLRGSGLPPHRLLTAYPYVDVMRTEVMAGQYLDLVSQAVQPAGATAAEEAMRVVRYKSAKYSVERPLHLGAALAGGTPELFPALSAYGLPLGEAFQLRDDILGVFGDPEVTGKPAGDDLREGKRTVLVAKTLEAATPPQAETFARGLGDPELAPDQVDALRELIVATGARNAVEHMINTLTEAAEQALAELPVTDEARTALAELARAATARTA